MANILGPMVAFALDVARLRIPSFDRPWLPWLAVITASVGLGLAAGGCTAPPDAASLPSSAPIQPIAMAASVVAEIPDAEALPLPPVGSIELLAASGESPVWAASDGRWLLVGSDDAEVAAIEREGWSAIVALAVDDGGSIFTVDAHDTLVRYASTGERQRTRALPVTTVESLHAAGEWIVVRGEVREGDEVASPRLITGESDFLPDYHDGSALAISRDGGETWAVRAMPSGGSFFNQLVVSPEGAMQWMIGEEAGCGGGWQQRWAGHVDRPGWRELAWYGDAPVDRQPTAGGRVYAWVSGYDACGGDSDFSGLCVYDRKSETRKVLAFDDGQYLVAHDGDDTLAVVDGALWALDRHRATRIVDGAPDLAGVQATAIDHQGRLLIADGGVVRAGPEGWTSMIVPG